MPDQPELSVPRSSRREVRNPVLALPALDELTRLPDESRQAIANLLMDLG